MSDQTTDTAVEQATPDTVEAPAGVQLTMQDLLLCAQIIQLTTQRGAFKAEELTQVGGLFDRLTTFLAASGAFTSASSAPSSDETTSSTTDNDTAESADGTVAE